MKVRKTLITLTLAALVAMMTGGAFDAHAFATCTGADPCRACKNCKYCGYCAKRGGTCGVCKPKK